MAPGIVELRTKVEGGRTVVGLGHAAPRALHAPAFREIDGAQFLMPGAPMFHVKHTVAVTLDRLYRRCHA
jgi:hypothetical protein